MQTSAQIRVMVVTDQPIMRDGLRLRIEQERDLQVVCEASDLSQATKAFFVCRPDLIVIDLQLPVGEGLRAISVVDSLSPRTPIVVLADSPIDLATGLPAREAPLITVSKIVTGAEVILAIRRAMGRTQTD